MPPRRTKWKPYLLTACWLVWLAVLCHAQQPYQHRYTTANGLLYPEAFINFAQNGEAWIYYSNGEHLTRFDGVNWTHYHLPSLNMPTSLAYATEDEHGIWFCHGSLQNLWMVRIAPNGAWHKYNLGGDKWLHHLSLQSPQLYDLSLYPYRYDAAQDSFLRDAHPLNIPFDSSTEEFHIINQFTNGIGYIGIKPKSESSFNYFYQANNEWQTQTTKIGGLQPYFLENGKLAGIIRMEDKPYWYSQEKISPIVPVLPNDRKGYAITPIDIHFWARKSKAAFPGIIVEDETNHQWHLYEMDHLGQPHHRLGPLSGEFPRMSIAQDRNGDWWYGNSNGIVRVIDNLLHFDETNPEMVGGLHTIVEDNQWQIWMGGYGGIGGLTVFDGKNLRRQHFTDASLRILPGGIRSQSGTLYFLSEYEGGLLSIKDGQLTTAKQLGLGDIVGFYAYQLSDGKIGLGLASYGLGIGTEVNGLLASIRIIGKEKGLLLDNVLTITEDQAGRLWLGRISQGIACYDPVQDTVVTWLRSPEMPRSVGVISTCLDGWGNLWLGGHNGLYRLSHAHLFDFLHDNIFDSLEKIELPGIDTSTVSFLQNTPNYLVVGSERAVYFFDKAYDGTRPRIFTLQYGQDIPGGGSEQNAVLFDSKGFLWLGTQEGAIRLDPKRLQFDTSATRLQLNYFTAGDTKISLADGQLGRLPAKKRNIRFEFSPVGNVLLKNDLFFNIAVVNRQGDTLFWRSQTKERNGEMPYLPKGSYVLHVTAYKHNVVSGQAAWYFTVPQLPSENPWTWIGLALVILAIPFTWFYLKNRHEAELEKSKRERDALQIRALSNFFNPHFINNALHWVQSRYRKDTDTAIIIGRLSENVDILFENTQSGKTFHSLVKELEIVKNYLKIQQVRFGEGLVVSFDLPQGEDELEETAVPSMLLQIHAENAVEKGIRNRKEAGHFLLSVKIETDGCHITMEDDGRGRPDTIPDRKGSTAVMNDLVALFNRYNRRPLTIHYDDFIFGAITGRRYGTRVHFFIPKEYNYELS
ncbi:MAG TPA: histidine kinase [Saprospiraceae bacterium]|nr:histidine kinase [Saprospiraceae bacterium]HMQ81620.1 histidine kinase [Saprospiraceae bacterium]